MERPWYQRTTAYVGYIIVGFVVVGGLLGAYKNARSVVTETATGVGSAIVVLGLSAAELFLRRSRRTWILQSGRHIFPTKLGVRAYLVSAGILLLLWTPRVAEWAVGRELELPPPGSYECRTEVWKLQSCRIEKDGAGERILLFNGPTHDPSDVVDTYSGTFQKSPNGISIAVRNEFSPDPGTSERTIQASLVVLRVAGPKAWEGIWQVADGSSHAFTIQRVSP